MVWRRVVMRVLVGLLVMATWLLASAALAPGVGRLSSGYGDRPLLDPGQVADRARPSVVRVEADTCAGPMSGTGFMVEGGRLVTNRHLVDGAGYVVVVGEGVVPPAVVVVDRIGQRDDLAGGALPRSAAPALPLAKSDPAPGTEVVLIGVVNESYRWLHGRVQLYGDGVVYGVGGPVLLLEPATTFGYSGGPVLNGSGEVVGVLQAVDQATGLSLAIPLSTLRQWLESDVDEPAATTCKE